jgi:hypothetical protein
MLFAPQVDWVSNKTVRGALHEFNRGNQNKNHPTLGMNNRQNYMYMYPGGTLVNE